VVNGMSGGFWLGGDNAVHTYLDIKGADSQNGVSFYNNGGGVTLYTGAALIAEQGFTQQAGGLNIVGATGNAALLCYSPQQPSANVGNVVINGGYVDFLYANQSLEVGNNYSMTGGSVDLTIDATAGTLDGIISFGGNITINNGCTVSVTTINI